MQGRWHLLALALAVATLHETAASPVNVRPGQLAVPVDPKGGGKFKPPEQEEGEDEATDPVAAALQEEEEKLTALKGTLHVGFGKNVLGTFH